MNGQFNSSKTEDLTLGYFLIKRSNCIVKPMQPISDVILKKLKYWEVEILASFTLRHERWHEEYIRITWFQLATKLTVNFVFIQEDNPPLLK